MNVSCTGMAAVALATPILQAQPAFKASVDLVTVPVTVAARDARRVGELGPVDFQIFEDGVSRRGPASLRFSMKIALIQQHATTDKHANIQRGLSALERAGRDGAGLACYAELAFEWFHPQRPAEGDVRRLAEPLDGPLVTSFQRKARALGIVVVLNFFERDDDNTFDSSPVIDSDGTLLGVTRMVHITEYACFHEQAYYTAGNKGAPVYRTRAGQVGVAICYDRHFPEYMRALAVAGADLVVVPQAGTTGEWPEGLYEAEMRVTAFQNGYYVALCNRVGREDRLAFAGESFVCAPDGQIIARAGQGTDEILYADVDLAATATSHARQLFMKHRRPELYAQWLAK